MLVEIEIDHGADRADVTFDRDYCVSVSFLDGDPVLYGRIVDGRFEEVPKWDKIDDMLDEMTGAHIITVGSTCSIAIHPDGWDITSVEGEQINGGSWDESLAFEIVV